MELQVWVLQPALDWDTIGGHRWPEGACHDAFCAVAADDESGDTNFVAGLGKDASGNVQ
jgi:hypothetical protein